VVSGSTFGVVIRCFRAGEDEVVQHYAAKAVENISIARTSTFAARFATIDMAIALLGVYTGDNGSSETLRATAVSAASRLCRRNAAIAHALVEKPGLEWLIGAVSGGSQKVLQAALTVLGVLLADTKTVSARVSKTMNDNRTTLLPKLLRLLEHAHPPVCRRSFTRLLIAEFWHYCCHKLVKRTERN
jgi:hypothetical protein